MKSSLPWRKVKMHGEHQPCTYGWSSQAAASVSQGTPRWPGMTLSCTAPSPHRDTARMWYHCQVSAEAQLKKNKGREGWVCCEERGTSCSWGKKQHREKKPKRWGWLVIEELKHEHSSRWWHVVIGHTDKDGECPNEPGLTVAAPCQKWKVTEKADLRR